MNSQHYRELWKAKGLCRNCGTNSVRQFSDRYTNCLPCRIKRARAIKAKRNALREGIVE